MARRKNTHLKSSSFSFKERGQLSRKKDLDVDYISHQKKIGKRGKSIYVQSCADPCYENSQQLSDSASPKKKVKRQPQGLQSIQEEWNRELDGDFGGDFSEKPRRKTKVRISKVKGYNLQLT